MSYRAKDKLAKRRECGVERLARSIGVETWVSDRLFPRYFFVQNQSRNNIKLLYINYLLN